MLDVDAQNVGFGGDREGARSLAALSHHRSRAQRVDHAYARRVEAAEDDRLVDVWDEALDLRGRDQRDGLDTP